MVKLFITLYLFVGALCTVYGWSQPGMFEAMRRAHDRTGPVGRWVAWGVAIPVTLLSWPIRIATILNPDGAWRHRLLSLWRRTTLDRDDLLKPQMPAPRCDTHRKPLMCAHVRCSVCGLVIHMPVCEDCPQPIADAPWVCPRHHGPTVRVKPL